MKISPALSFLVAALQLASISGQDDHDHKDGHPCACEVEELEITIDCSNQQAMTEALSALSANGCSTSCGSEICHKNYVIVQVHHDYCLHDEVPETVEEGLHDFEEICEGCVIYRRFDLTLTSCPTAVCGDGSAGAQAFANLVDNNCGTTCTEATCAADYRILRAEHDRCEEGVLSNEVESGIHNFEDPCEAFNCNIFPDEPTSAAQLLCFKEEPTVSGGTSSNLGYAAAVVAAFAAAV